MLYTFINVSVDYAGVIDNITLAANWIGFLPCPSFILWDSSQQGLAQPAQATEECLG
jgi:hypothetical protein